MKVLYSWLKDYVDIDITPQELEEKLFSCGFEVEELYEIGKDISNVVVGLVEECDPIPDTHLHVCKVNVGQGENLQICIIVDFTESLLSLFLPDFCWCQRVHDCQGSQDRRRRDEDQEGQAAWL